MKRTINTCFIATALLASIFGQAACGKSEGDDGMSKEQKVQSDRLHQIATKSGGDWDKLSQSEKDEVLVLVHGNEQSARMLLRGASGGLRGQPGGAPGRSASPPSPSGG